MRSFIVILILALSGCNGSSDDDSLLATKAQLPPNESTQVATLQAEVSSLQTQVQKFNQLQIIGKPVSQGLSPDDFRTMGDVVLQVVTSFGPCTNMGVQEGFSSLIGDALSAISKTFHTCMGYHVEYLTSNGAVKNAPRVFFDGANCTGNILEWEASGFGYDTEDLQDGVVFTNPVDNTTVLKVDSHQTPQPILIQSVWVSSNPGCQVDTETQNMYLVSSNDVNITGVPSIPIGPFTTVAP